MTIAFDTFRHYGRPQQQQQSALFFGILLSKASVYCCDAGQIDQTSSSSKTSSALAGSTVSAIVGERATFFYTYRSYGMTKE
jgi:hypothetical protein